MFDWLYPQTVEKVNSSINGEIKITKSRGRYSVWVNKFEQSGPMYVETIWRKALQGLSLLKQGESLINVLILGLGCGTLVKLITKKWPKAKIVGVEVDPVMIGLAKKYFALGQNKNLKIVCADAKQYIKSANKKFDLILVDAYIGNQKKTIEISNKLLNKGGATITNNLIGLKNELVVKYKAEYV